MLPHPRMNVSSLSGSLVLGRPLALPEAWVCILLVSSVGVLSGLAAGELLPLGFTQQVPPPRRRLSCFGSASQLRDFIDSHGCGWIPVLIRESCYRSLGLLVPDHRGLL